MNVDAFFPSTTTTRGDFCHCVFVRPGKRQVVLGLITTATVNWRTRKGESASGRLRATYERADLPQPAVRICLHGRGNSLSEAQQDKIHR